MENLDHGSANTQTVHTREEEFFNAMQEISSAYKDALKALSTIETKMHLTPTHNDVS